MLRVKQGSSSAFIVVVPCRGVCDANMEETQRGVIRVVVADDHYAVRAGVRALLEDAPDIAVVGEAGDGVEALRLVKELTPDVLLLDVEMPRLTGIEVARRLEAAELAVSILILSAYDDRHYVRGVLSSGVAGYLTKDEAPQKLVEAVRAVSRGETGWVSQRIAVQMARWMKAEAAQNLGFSDQEIEALRLMVAGTPLEEVATALGVSQEVAEDCWNAICDKLQAESRWNVIAGALQKGLI